MKKIFVLLISLLTIFNFTGCSSTSNPDAIKFKDEYESINDQKNTNGQAYRNIEIDKENPFIYITQSEIIEKIENKETFYIYFGSLYCPWCRSVIEQAIKSAKKNNIDKIYYLNIWSLDHDEIFRDTYILNDNNEPEKIHDGTDEYYKILEYFDSVLSDYALTDSEGNKVKVNEKRIFAPNFIYVKNGKAIRLIEGISEKQKNPKEELTSEILLDQEKIFDNFFEK